MKHLAGLVCVQDVQPLICDMSSILPLKTVKAIFCDNITAIIILEYKM